ncbi:MAG: alpha/beta fold hydrolase [Chloroflexi bacterium]|nr:alpha/beta fold hydrolase [Chloroflexota bacterium]
MRTASPPPTLAESARIADAADRTEPAVIDGAVRWTWRDLDRRAGAVVHGLVDAGVGPGDRVALLVDPSAAAVAALHGIARLGAVAAPLATNLTGPELTVAFDVVAPAAVIGGPGQPAASTGSRRPTIEVDALAGTDRHPAATPMTATEPATDPDAPSLIVLTSGTTGRPKAVILSTRALVASAEAWLAALPEPTGWLLALGLGHVAGQGVVWRAALSGVPLVIVARPDAAAIAAALAADPAPSHGSLVPTQLARLLGEVGDAAPPPSLRALLLGGGTIPPALVERAIAAGWPVVPTYGLTEAGSGVSALPSDEAAAHPTTAGRALPGVAIAIAEPDPDGVGEILVGTPARFTGYLADPAASAAAITEAGWLRTGDLGSLDPAGRLTVLDRRTDRIVRGGENISPVEVETVLLDHPAIADVGVVARRDATFGHVPVAAIVLRDEAPNSTDDDLTRHCRERLATFKVPQAFIRLPTLPRTASGKLQRAELRARLDPDPSLDRAAARDRTIRRPDGVDLAYRSVGHGSTPLLLLHGTLSTGGQLVGLARALADTGDLTVHAVDRRGSGRSRLADPAPIDAAVHVDDLAAILDAEGCAAAILVGVSFGGVVALEFAARRPDRTLAVVAYEPPYGPLADEATQLAFANVATTTERAYVTGGAPSAARAFMRGVTGPAAWDRLPERTQAFLEREGNGALVDAGLRGLDPDGLGEIRVRTTILTGSASEPLYRPIAETLTGRIPGARHVALPGLTHASPITDPIPVVAALRAAIRAAIDPEPTEEPRP